MRLSQRIAHIPASPIRKLVPYADEAKRKGIKIFHLNIGQPDIPTPSPFFEAIRNWDGKVIAYTKSEGTEQMREAWANYYRTFVNVNISSEQVIVTDGASEALSFLFTILFDPGDEVIIPEPFYANYLSFARDKGVKVTPLTTTIETNFALPSPELFERYITKRTKAILICNPANPTGRVYSADTLKMLGELAERYDLFLIGDEVYREFVYEGEFCSLLSLERFRDRVVVVDSVSKRFSACGARIGALITFHPGILDGARRLAQARLSPPLLDQIGATALLNQLDSSFYKEMIGIFLRRRNVLLKGLAEMEGARYSHPEGAFYVMIELPVEDMETFCKWLLTDFSYQGMTLMLAPGTGFYENAEYGKRQARIAYVLDEHDLQSAIHCLTKALEVYPRKVSQSTF